MFFKTRGVDADLRRHRRRARNSAGRGGHCAVVSPGARGGKDAMVPKRYWPARWPMTRTPPAPAIHEQTTARATEGSCHGHHGEGPHLRRAPADTGPPFG